MGRNILTEALSSEFIGFAGRGHWPGGGMLKKDAGVNPKIGVFPPKS